MSVIGDSAIYKYYCSRCLHRNVCKYMLEFCVMIDDSNLHAFQCRYYKPYMPKPDKEEKPILKVVK